MRFLLASLMSMLIGGVIHRFPKLRVGFMESGCGWLPFWLERIDEHWELTPEQPPKIDRKPSEYFLSGRCFVGMDPEEPDVPWVVKRCGEDCDSGSFVGVEFVIDASRVDVSSDERIRP